MESKYDELFKLIPPTLMVENIIPLDTGDREVTLSVVSKIPDLYQYYRAIERDMNQVNSRTFMGNFTPSRNQKEYIQKFLDGMKGRMDIGWFDLLPEFLGKSRTVKSLRDIGIGYDLHVRAGIFNPESPGISPPPNYVKDENYAAFIMSQLATGASRIMADFLTFKPDKKDHVSFAVEELNHINEKKWGAMDGLMMTEESIKYASMWAEKYGKLLGYPECCIEPYAGSRMTSFLRRLEGKTNSRAHEDELARERLFDGQHDFLAENVLTNGELDYTKFVELAKQELPEFFYSSYVHKLYPCTSHCQQAISMGKSIEDSLENIDSRYATVYRMNRINALIQTLGTDFMSYKSRIQMVEELEELPKPDGELISEMKEEIGEIGRLIEEYNIKGFPGYSNDPIEFRKLLSASSEGTPLHPLEYFVEVLAHEYLEDEDVDKLNTMSSTDIKKMYDSIYFK